MSGPAPAVAAVRAAVRAGLADVPDDRLVLVALSGGADSLALTAAAAFLRPGRVGVIVADHGWHAGSAEVAAAAVASARALGADPAELVCLGPLPPGEGAARTARYQALGDGAGRHRAAAVLLGHTLDDQAETVLLGLARGSGARSLAGMAGHRGVYRRPLLGLPRATTRAACRELGLVAYQDQANADPRFARSRVRHRLLPALEAELGPGMAPALARSAAQLREDADLLDALAHQQFEACGGAAGLVCEALVALPAALRRRVLRLAGPVRTAAHVEAVDALVMRWRGQGPVGLPGGGQAVRRHGRILFVPPATEPALAPPAPPAAAPPPPAPDSAVTAEGAPAPELPPDVAQVLLSETRIAGRVRELAGQIDADYAGREVVLVGVLKGAIMVMADLSRALTVPTSLEFMAVSSYGSATTTSGVVRILKDLDRDITGRHVLVVEDVIDSGLTLSWLLRNLRSRGPASLEVCALLRKPEAVDLGLPVRYVGFDIGREFVVGYGLDAAERYRGLPYVGLLRPTT